MGTVVVDQMFEVLWGAFLLLAIAVGSSVVFVGTLLQAIENAARHVV
jgi:hypothetical protein